MTANEEEVTLYFGLSEEDAVLQELVDQNHASATHINVNLNFKNAMGGLLLAGPDQTGEDNAEACQGKWYKIVGETFSRLKGITFTNSFRFGEVGNPIATLDMRALGELFRLRAASLESVVVEHSVFLRGSQEDTNFMLEAFKGLVRLKRFRLFYCTDLFGASNSVIHQELLEILSNMDSLEEVSLQNNDIESFPDGGSPQGALGRLCRKPISLRLGAFKPGQSLLPLLCDGEVSRLVKLDLHYVPQVDVCLRHMIPAFRNNAILKELRITGPRSGPWSNAAVPASSTCALLWSMLAENTELKSLHLDLVHHRSENFEGISQAIASIGSLQKMSLRVMPGCDPDQNAACVSCVLAGLAHNDSLTKVDIEMHHNEGAQAYKELYTSKRQDFNQKLEDSLATNSTLEHITLTVSAYNEFSSSYDSITTTHLIDGDDASKLHVFFWLKYNRAGRKTLEADRDNHVNWVETLLQHKDDTQLVFHLISTNLGAYGGYLQQAAATAPVDSASKRRRVRTQHRPLSTFTLVAFLLLCLQLGQTLAKHSGGDYLYNAMPPDEATPILEYIPPKDNNTKNNMGGAELEQPDFMYSTTGPAAVARVVEFYAPWCPHCQHFAPKYVKFARRMLEIIKPYGIQMDFYAVSCVTNKKLCQQQEIHGYPTIMVFPAGSNNGTVAKYYELHPFLVLRDIGLEVDAAEIAETDTVGEDTTERHLKGKGKAGKKYTLSLPNERTKAEIYADAYRSFHFAMKTGVFMTNGPLPNSTVPVLHNWLNLLQNTLPPTWNIHPLIRRMLNEFDTIIQGEDQMVAVLDQFPPTSTEWSFSCTQGVEAMGYTCGLWELFHIMTVGVVEYNEQVVTDDSYSFYRTEQVADDLRDYISNFFACEVCRMNFLQAYDNCALERCNRLQDQVGDMTMWKQLPLWLFETHNSVNVRLMKEEAEREGHKTTHQDEMNAQWPSRLACPKCWKPDGSWNEEIAYLYVFDQYWPDDGKTSQATRRALFQATLNIDPEDMDHERSFLSSALKYGPVLFLLVTIGYFYKKRTDVVKTGRHKKRDY